MDGPATAGASAAGGVDLGKPGGGFKCFASLLRRFFVGHAPQGGPFMAG